MKEMAGELGIELFIPALSLCTDNAAMIAAAGYFHFKNENFSDMSLNPLAYLPLATGG
jgi:N6-L-threonylcarbamoyladenine synthase